MRTSALALALVVAALTGCAAVTPSPTPTMTERETSSPAATPTAQPADPCGGLLDEATARAAFGDVVDATDPAATIAAAAPHGIPKPYWIRSLGGVACEFSNGVAYSSNRGFVSDYVGLRVQALPDAADGWQRLQDKYQGQAGGAQCSTNLGPVVCTSEALVGDTWVSIYVQGAEEEAGRTLISSIESSAASFVGSAAVDQSSAGALPTLCSDVISNDTVESILGTGDLYFDVPHGGWSIEADAWLTFGGLQCFWLPMDGPDLVMSLDALPAGAWAWHERQQQLTGASAPDAVSIAGADEAWVRCSAADECALDLIVQENWIEVTLWASDRPGDRRAELESIGAIVADALG
ncbi:hypothetical protein [Schumannella luteola]